MVNVGSSERRIRLLIGKQITLAGASDKFRHHAIRPEDRYRGGAFNFALRGVTARTLLAFPRDRHRGDDETFERRHGHDDNSSVRAPTLGASGSPAGCSGHRRRGGVCGVLVGSRVCAVSIRCRPTRRARRTGERRARPSPRSFRRIGSRGRAGDTAATVRFVPRVRVRAGQLLDRRRRPAPRSLRIASSC